MLRRWLIRQQRLLILAASNESLFGAVFLWSNSYTAALFLSYSLGTISINYGALLGVCDVGSNLFERSGCCLPVH